MRFLSKFILRTVFSGLLLLSGIGFGIGAAQAADEYELDEEHTYIAFKVGHIGYNNAIGFFRESEGSFLFDEDTKTLSELKVTIETDSVYTMHKRRDNHLRSPDFLNSKEFPEMTFVMTKAEALTETTGRIEGDLTLLGQTRPVTLDVTLNKVGPYPFGNNYVIGVSATADIKRSDFGMTYAVDNGLVGDDVHLMLEIEAIRQ